MCLKKWEWKTFLSCLQIGQQNVHCHNGILKKIPEVLARAIREEKEKIDISILFADCMI